MRSPPPPMVGNVLPLTVLLPMVLFYSLFLARYGHTLLLRTDENVLLLRTNGLVSGGAGDVSPLAVFILRRLAPVAAPIIAGRAIAALSALVCAALTWRIARQLFRSAPNVARFAMALLLSSTLFVAQGSVARTLMPALACALGAVALLLETHSTGLRRRLLMLYAGLLFGSGLQLAPFIFCYGLFAIWLLRTPLRPNASPTTKWTLVPLLVHATGWALPTLVLLALVGPRGLAFGSGLVEQIATLPTEIGPRALAVGSAAIAFAESQRWVLLLCGLGVAVATRRPNTPGAAIAWLLTRWFATALALLILAGADQANDYVYLLPPLAIGAAMFCEQVRRAFFAPSDTAAIPSWHLVLLASILAILGPLAAAIALPAQQPGPGITAAAQAISSRTSPSNRIWADEPLIPLLAERPIEPALLPMILRRPLPSELQQTHLARIFAAHPPAAVVDYRGLLQGAPIFLGCLARMADTDDIALNGQTIYWPQPQAPAMLQGCAERSAAAPGTVLIPHSYIPAHEGY